MGELAHASDRMLVECYANEMACAGGLSESVSYGWALDAFLADPTEFRARVRSVRPPSDVVSLQSASTTDAFITTANLSPFSLAPRGFSLAPRGFSSKYRGVSWSKSHSKWESRITSASVLIGYFESEEDAARAYDNYVQEHNLNVPLNANADGVLVARERGSVYQGVKNRERTGGKQNFAVYVHAHLAVGYQYVYIGMFDDETQAAIAHDAYVRTTPPTTKSRRVNFLTFDEQTKLKLPRPFLIQIVRKTNRNGLGWEKATITECRTENSAHAEEHSACLLYFLEFEGGSTPSCWDSLVPSDPMSCVLALRQVEVTDAPKKTAPAKRSGAAPKKAPAGDPPAPREHDWWKRFQV